MSVFSSLGREQKEAIVLLQTGTFLEYFDLLLYVHMGVLLNELFFPKTDSHTIALLGALGFCTTYLMRPLGALLFGYLGDHFGRKKTVVLTTTLMALSCLTMAGLPTYAQIGITASWVITLCRMMQGMSSLGEVIGAELYLTEMIKLPARYPIVASLSITPEIGGLFALVIASVATTSGFNWRHAFLIGALIAFVGTIARTRLRETPEFADMKRRMKKVIEEADENNCTRASDLLKKTRLIWREKVSKRTGLAFFLIECGGPVCFFMSFIYMNAVMRNTFGYTPEQIIHHNLIISLVGLSRCVFFTYLSSKVHPLKLLRMQVFIFTPFILFYPYILVNYLTIPAIFVFQIMCSFFTPITHPASAVFYVYFPIYRRFTCGTLIHALSSIFIFTVASFGLVYLTEIFNHWGILFIEVPMLIGFVWGLRHFEGLEKTMDSTSFSLMSTSSSVPDEIHSNPSIGGAAA